MRVGVVLYTQDDPFINALTECMKENFEKYESDTFKITMTVRDGKMIRTFRTRLWARLLMRAVTY